MNKMRRKFEVFICHCHFGSKLLLAVHLRPASHPQHLLGGWWSEQRPVILNASERLLVPLALVVLLFDVVLEFVAFLTFLRSGDLRLAELDSMRRELPVRLNCWF